MRSSFPFLAAVFFLSIPAMAQDATYEKQFQIRAEYYLRSIAAEDPTESTAWARRINLGDPHKYAMPPIIARLHFDPKDAQALQAYRDLREVDQAKDDRGLDHFAAYPRTRMYFAFRDQLPKDIVDSMRYDVSHFFPILRRGGTENHTWMHRTSGYLWTEELPDVGKELVPSSKSGDAHEASDPTAGRTNQEWLRQWLVQETKKFYNAGQGEYDSSTYVVFTAASWANIYDYSKDPHMHDLSRAALDWLAAAQALKYFHGCNVGPEARGFAEAAVRSNTDWMNWLWFGDGGRDVLGHKQPATNNDDKGSKEGKELLPSKHGTVILALSAYRPHPVIRHLAEKSVPLPFEARGSKPSYYGAKDNKDQEYLYFNDAYAMGTLYSGETGIETTGTILPQTTMFKLGVRGKDDTLTFGMTNGYHGHFPGEGRTPYDQYHQYKNTAIDICYVNKDVDERTRYRSILAVPLSLDEPRLEKGWYIWQTPTGLIAARPLNGRAEFADATSYDDKTKKAAKVTSKSHRFLISPGKLTGWVIRGGQLSGGAKPKEGSYASVDAFVDAVANRTKIDLSKFESDRIVTVTTEAGDTLLMRHTGGPGGKPEASNNGRALEFANWPVFESPYLKEDVGKGILRINDGKDTLTIDFSGEWPKFSESPVR